MLFDMGVLDVDHVAHNLWIGSAPPDGPYLASAGFNVVFLCAEEIQPAHYRFFSTRVVRAPMKDECIMEVSLDTRRIASAAAMTVNEWRRHGPALVTCAAGRNRSGLVCGLALWLSGGMSGKECADLVKQRREGALSNECFDAFLCSLPRRR